MYLKCTILVICRHFINMIQKKQKKSMCETGKRNNITWHSNEHTIVMNCLICNYERMTGGEVIIRK